MLIEVLFDHVVQLGIELDLIGFDHASIDGTIFKANASKKRIIRIEELNYLNPY